MALSKNIEFNGIEVQNAYIKVENVVVEKNSMMATVIWRAKADSQPLKNKSYGLEYDINGKNPLAQSYDRLKSLPEFDGATDV